jgi:chromosomal replication initiator protein DnaA
MNLLIVGRIRFRTFMQSDSDRARRNTIRTVQGGADTMKMLSKELKSSAVVILERIEGQEKIHGYISYKSGTIVEALFKISGSEGTLDSKQGRDALKSVWHEALNTHSKLRVYSIPPKELQVGEFEGIDMHQTSSPRRFKKVRRAAIASSDIASGGGDDIAVQKVNEQEGEESKSSEDSADFEERAMKVRELEKRLSMMDTPAFSSEVSRISDMLKDHDRLEEAERSIERLMGKMQQKERTGGGKQKEVKQHADTAVSDYDEVYGLVFGLPKGQEASCPNCGSKLSGQICEACGYAATGRDSRSMGLNPSMLFSNFVVGPGNKFSYAASLSIAEVHEENYNPLYIFAPAGFGKTHLLNAIGNMFLSRKQGAKVLYIGAERFCEEVHETASVNRRDSLLRKFRELDLLLFDDVQFLSGKESAQEEFFGIINAMLKSGVHVVCAADRAPKEIKSLDSQISTRLESGLLVDIRPLDLETRIKILDMRIREENYAIPRDVVRFIAETFEDNVRELTGALNRVVAYSALMKLQPSVEAAKRMLRGGGQEQKKDGNNRVELKPGHGYIVEEDRPDLCHLLLQEKIAEKWSALDITRVNPSRLRGRYPGLEKARVVWLTDRESEKEITLEPSLEKIEHEIKSFIENNCRGGGRVIVNIDDLQYVISNTSFEGTVRLLRRMLDEISERNSLLTVSVGKETLGKQEIAILEREMELI